MTDKTTVGIDKIKVAQSALELAHISRNDTLVKEGALEQTIGRGQLAVLIDIADSLRTLVKDGISKGPWHCLCSRSFSTEAWLDAHYDQTTESGHEGPRPGSES